jgi:hypothetical protein
MSLAGWLNTAWMVKCLPEAWAFHRATRQVARAQAEVLARILRANCRSEFGRRHGFASIDSPRAFRARVPLSRYEDYEPALGRIAAGESNVLTCEPVILLEPTSGTVAGEKLVPYTQSLRREFQRAVAAWIADLFRHRPAVRRGQAYWSISPALGPPRRSAGGLRIGFDSDSAYLGTLEQFALSRLLVVPPGVARLRDMEAFRYATLRCLLQAPDLTLISVWSPTFLSALLAPLEEWRERLAADLEPRRADLVRATAPLPEKLRQLWPRLALISCWADGASAGCLGEVQRLFPGVEIQPKGLLATEGCVSLPLVGRAAPALAIRSHFYEFQPVGGGDCRLAHELDAGGRYHVVMTTGGGLYRYELRDEVEVVGFEHRCPLLRFVGKADRVSDLVGEKLAEPHVRRVLDRIMAELELTSPFALLVPVAGAPARYRLYWQGAAHTELGARLEAGLRENPYYRHAVEIGQIAAAEVVHLPDGTESGWRVYERRCLALGQKAGNIKPAALDAWTGWPAEFAALESAWVG